MCKSQMYLNRHFPQLSNVPRTSNWKLLANCKKKPNRNSVTGEFSLSARRWRSNIWEADKYIEYFFTWQSNVYLIKRILLIKTIHLNFDSIYYIELYNSSGYKLHNIHVHYIISHYSIINGTESALLYW